MGRISKRIVSFILAIVMSIGTFAVNAVFAVENGLDSKIVIVPEVVGAEESNGAYSVDGDEMLVDLVLYNNTGEKTVVAVTGFLDYDPNVIKAVDVVDISSESYVTKCKGSDGTEGVFIDKDSNPEFLTWIPNSNVEGYVNLADGQKSVAELGRLKLATMGMVGSVIAPTVAAERSVLMRLKFDLVGKGETKLNFNYYDGNYVVGILGDSGVETIHLDPAEKTVKVNVIEGLKEGWDVGSTSSINTETAQKIKISENGTKAHLTVSGGKGKLSSGEDAFVYYGTRIPDNEDFELSATVDVKSLNEGVNGSKNQSGYGIAFVNDLYDRGGATNSISNAEKDALGTNFKANGAFGGYVQQLNASTEGQISLRTRTGEGGTTVSPFADMKSLASASVTGLTDGVNDRFELTLKRVGNKVQFICGENSDTYTFEESELKGVSGYLYPLVYVARGADVEFSNISLVTEGVTIIPDKESTEVSTEASTEMTTETAVETTTESAYNISKPEAEENFAAEDGAISEYKGSSEVVIVPTEINGEPVKEIKKDFIPENTEVKDVVLPETIEKVDPEAFKGDVEVFCDFKSKTANALNNANVTFTFIGDVDGDNDVNKDDVEKVLEVVRNVLTGDIKTEDGSADTAKLDEKGEKSARLASTRGNITATTAARIYFIVMK